MKTKSKRFLNLATLCLALLGTTLLMAHPVKAEFVKQNEGSGKSKVQEQSPYVRGKSEGYQKGLEDGKVAGKKPGTTSEPLQGSDSPGTTPYTNADENGRYTRAYKEWYLHGYRAGWHGIHNKTSERGNEDETPGASQENKGRQEEGKTSDASQENKGRQEEGKTSDASQENKGPQEESETPDASQENKGRQEGSDNEQEDIFSPIVKVIIEAVLEAWTQVLSWFNP
ncbi:hypothetical membrane associated protein [Streptococcus pyogenes]|uniref:hypothetical protein n=1 Tax=Streptococcus pyogenes TaxID=1314 RepID=UPI0010A12801|nr:hypothetical protein [Streptococcus pyogenes]VGS80555.1 hypothetical membrane associated protein [Streptococcus pyogenes]